MAGWLQNAIAGLKASPTIDYVQARVGEPGNPIEPDTAYLRIWLRSARLVQVRRWTRKCYATVHARFTFADAAAGQREVAGVVAPDRTFEALDPAHLDRFIVVNRPLLGPVPYRGELGLEVGLFSIDGVDLAKPYLELLSELTEQASVSFLAQAAPFAEPIKRGAALLLGNGNATELEIGVARTDTMLTEGNLVVARMPKDAIDPSQLRLDPNDWRLLDAVGRPAADFPYMVLGFERVTRRDEAKLPEVLSGWNELRALARDDKSDELATRFRQLRRTIMLSPDLIRPDARRIVADLQQQLADVGFEKEVGLAPAAGHLENAGAALESAPASAGGRELPELAVILPPVDRAAPRTLQLESATPTAAAAPVDVAAEQEAALADREAEAVDAEADAAERDAARAGLEAAPLAPVPADLIARISPEAAALIIQHETGGRAYYDKVIKARPIWPGAGSGITIGFGYDLGYPTKAGFDNDWPILGADARDALRPCIGQHGSNTSPAALKALVAQLADVIVSFDAGETVFRAVSLPDYAARTWRALPNCEQLHPHCFGSLVSLTFNRGASYGKAHDPAKDPKDRYREMRAIKAAMMAGNPAAIPGQIRAMKRVWVGTSIETEMTRRRENEARLFEQGLAATPVAARSTLESTMAGLESVAPATIPLDADSWAGPTDEDFWVDLDDANLAAAARDGTAGLESMLEAAADVRWAEDTLSPDYAHLGAGLPIGTVFQLLPDDLELLALLNDFPVDEAGNTPILFGLRGCTIVADHAGTSREVTLRDQRPDHESPRCTMGVWDRAQSRIMVFPGSTVPNAKAVRQFFTQGDAGNLLPTGLYRYIVGTHNGRPGCFLLRKPSGDPRVVVVRRSADDLTYTTTDRHHRCPPGDNIHPSFRTQPTSFSSLGCQTVVGMADNTGNHQGPWAAFRKAAGLADADGDPGKPYLYMLLTGAEARLASDLRRADLARDPVSQQALRRLRAGAKGGAVRRLQAALGLPSPDGDLGPATTEALYDRQRTLSGHADGILTPELDQAQGWGVFEPAVS